MCVGFADDTRSRELELCFRGKWAELLLAFDGGVVCQHPEEPVVLQDDLLVAAVALQANFFRGSHRECFDALERRLLRASRPRAQGYHQGRAADESPYG